MNNFTNEQFYIWLAGFIDGEGCVYVSRAKNEQISWGYQYSLRLEITQADEVLLNTIKERVNSGCVLQNKALARIKGRASKRLVYSIKWSSNNAYELLKKVYPYLVVKQKQAKLAIEFQELVREHYGKRVNRPVNYSEKQSKLRELLQVAKLDFYFKAP